MTALALLLGRPIDLTEYPDRVDGLVASLCQTQRGDGRSPVPAALIDWLRRALLRDASAKFGSVSDARLSLESVLSSQEAATGGASALKSLAETFGQHAAALEARAAAEAAEKARKAAIAAQEAVRAALQEQAADAAAAVPITDLVPAFTLQSDERPDTPVGWRVPEPPPVEETLPTSPLIQIDTPPRDPAAEEFVEEVLDLSGLAGPDDGDLAAAVDVLAAEAAPAPVVQAGTLEPDVSLDPAVEAVEVVDLRDLAAAATDPESLDPVPAVLDASPALLAAIDAAAVQLDAVDAAAVQLEAVDVAPAQLETVDVAPAVLELGDVAPITPAALVDAALDALAALEGAPPSLDPSPLPEWRLLADPVGAIAPTIDVVEPLESLDELVAEFAATEMTAPAPAPPDGLPMRMEEEPSTGVEPPAIPAEPPVAMLESPLPLFEAPVAFTSTAALRQAEPEIPTVVQPSVLDEILNLQESQAAAQADVEPGPEPVGPAPDIAAWSFVEELLHHDARFEAHADVADVPPALEAEPPAEAALPALPPDWFVEVRPTPATPAPLLVSPVEPEVLVEDGPEDVPEEMPRPLPAARPVEPPRFEAMPAASRFESPAGMRPEPEAPDEDESGPVFPRVAPSVRRVRAEARRRRIARLRSGGVELLESVIGACSSAAGSVAAGLGHAVSAVGRGIATAARLVLSAAVLLTTAVSRGAGGAVRAVAAGAGAVAKGGARATSQLAHAAGTAFSAVVAGAGAVIRVLASATSAAAGRGSKAAVAMGGLAPERCRPRPDRNQSGRGHRAGWRRSAVGRGAGAVGRSTGAGGRSGHARPSRPRGSRRRASRGGRSGTRVHRRGGHCCPRDRVVGGRRGPGRRPRHGDGRVGCSGIRRVGWPRGSVSQHGDRARRRDDPPEGLFPRQ